jgi:hypothetical protein
LAAPDRYRVALGGQAEDPLHTLAIAVQKERLPLPRGFQLLLQLGWRGGMVGKWR